MIGGPADRSNPIHQGLRTIRPVNPTAGEDIRPGDEAGRPGPLHQEDLEFAPIISDEDGRRSGSRLGGLCPSRRELLGEAGWEPLRWYHEHPGTPSRGTSPAHLDEPTLPSRCRTRRPSSTPPTPFRPRVL